ncbi:SpoIIE family protein phosphatase [Mucilaginibacter auburnensis]|uniref:Anti-sigma regulatory factor (Ser/Thr protein kinase) n=1 Tax=Mucilaginibacter auburnensis TaxID=1457233 RepID=A0A2H9VMX8_9SPHI|nr:SpoIIE family protein phosphatase [Mucilaginibacter auburnensis]PJJ79675.1 anti-sigma regulatory factor (Ser/Thr protein kinase) [Mucilaginibacter auburnensis]
MVDATHTSFNASDRSYYAILKKEIHAIAVQAGIADKKLNELDIIVAEMTSNLHKYAMGGELLVAYFDKPGEEYIELISIDNGPGIAELQKALVDGYSTANSMGHGLGSIKRFSDEFDIYSLKGWGTIVLSRIYKTKQPSKSRLKTYVQIRPIVIKKPGETTSGDGHYVKATDGMIKLLVADGLGHGPEANLAVNEAVKSFKSCPYNSPADIIRYIHRDIRKTRGIVGTVAIFDMNAKAVRIAGVGNISSRLSGGVNNKTLLAYNGIIGHNIPTTMNDHLMHFADYQQLVLCSDGIKSRWETIKHAGINRCDNTILAAAIYKDFSRQTDDMSVIIARVK